MAEPIGINYRLEIEVLTPLHVGSGRTLMQGFDFEVHDGRTFRLREDVILDDYWPDDGDQQRLLLSKPLSDLLQPEDYRQQPHFFAYTLKGQPALREIMECIKDPNLQPYLPGSSLKGAMRTALMRAILRREKRRVGQDDIRWGRGPRAAKAADDKLDQAVFGPDPNSDLMRVLRVGDSQPVPAEARALTRIQMVPGLDIDVEAIAPGTRLDAPLYLETHLLERTDRRLRWPRKHADLVADFVAACREAARERLAHEYEYHAARRRDVQATSFYARIVEEFVSERWPANEFLVQVGFAAGWRSKSVLGGAENSDPLLDEVVQAFELDRGGKRKGKSGGYVQGEPFPKARHLAYVRGKPALPLGWLRVRAVVLEPEKMPTIHEAAVVPSRPAFEPPKRVEPEPPRPITDPSAPEDEPPPAPPERPVTLGPRTGKVRYYNMAEGRGTILLDEEPVEVEVGAQDLRSGVRYLFYGQAVSLTLVQVGEERVARDVEPV